MHDAPVALRVFLPVYFVSYIFFGLTYNRLVLRRRYGVDPLETRLPHPLSRLGDLYRNGMFAVVLLMVGAFAVDPSILDWLVPVPYLDVRWIRWTGVGVLLLALAVVRVSQSHMKASWRPGLDLDGPPPELVTDGVFTLTRNPIYLGMILTALGLFLVLPNAVTLALLPLTVLLLQIRVRVEEEYLLDRHGEAYLDYCRRTPRWLVGRGAPPG